MKLITLMDKRAHQQGGLDETSSGIHQQAHTYTELRQQIHDDLRIQHPNWIQPNGECPMCDAYEARLMELLGPMTGKIDDESVGASAITFEHGLN
jgi:hypothetical protein